MVEIHQRDLKGYSSNLLGTTRERDTDLTILSVWGYMWRDKQSFFITALFLHEQPLVSVCGVFRQQHAFICSHFYVKDANQHNRL